MFDAGEMEMSVGVETSLGCSFALGNLFALEREEIRNKINKVGFI